MRRTKAYYETILYINLFAKKIMCLMVKGRLVGKAGRSGVVDGEEHMPLASCGVSRC